MRWPLALLVVCAGCGGAEPDDDGTPEALPTDTTLAALVADLHLADARAETSGEPLDSLYGVAWQQHAIDSTEYRARLAEATQTPEATSALYGAVSDFLDPSRQP